MIRGIICIVLMAVLYGLAIHGILDCLGIKIFRQSEQLEITRMCPSCGKDITLEWCHVCNCVFYDDPDLPVFTVNQDDP